jgi:hypothetical protein
MAAAADRLILLRRLAVAAAVVGIGLVTSLPFRRSSAVPPTVRHGKPEDGAKLILRHYDITLQASPHLDVSPAPNLTPVHPAGLSTTPPPLSTSESPQVPDLPSQYRSLLDPHSTTPQAKPAAVDGRVLGVVQDRTAQAGAPLRDHVVVDGDTLQRLAERYLGAASRAAEIRELNANLIGVGDELPINAVLRIPPADRR